MNKKDFIKELSKRTGIDEEKCGKINEVIEGNFLVGKKNKDKMIEEFKSKLNLSEDDANKVYETAMGIIGGGIMDKIKNPFKSQD